MLDYQLIRSNRRKTIALQVKQGQVLVRAPHFVHKQIINDLIYTKSAWLHAKIAEQSHTALQCFSFKQGDTLFFLGHKVCLNINYAERAETFLTTVTDDISQLTVVLTKRYKEHTNDNELHLVAVKKQLEIFFKQQAHTMLLPKVTNLSQLTQLKPKAIKIRQYSARWGSCNSKGELSFNYLMMMLPENVIDYIVVHELCHLRFLNHSKDFWQLVSIHFPQYHQAKSWLKEHQSQLVWRLP
ncbi:MAG: SprT family zinc-dependent metalloprotease [Litorilituus sp.]|jgi:hypothetical protein|nr:SprT family zinc-dependent metalloprotease [Litorilituus sp.]